MSKEFNRKDFMTDADKKAMGVAARTHQTCLKNTGKARPGKTACDKARNGR